MKTPHGFKREVFTDFLLLLKLVLVLLVFYFCLVSFVDLVVCSDYGESGQEITLKPNIRGKPQEILWKHNGNMIVEYDESQMMEFGSFKGRVVLDFETGQLTIRNLNIYDSGQYQSEILINGKIQSSGQNVTVLGKFSSAFTFQMH